MSLSSKNQRRRTAKRRKLEAFLALAELNDKDRKAKRFKGNDDGEERPSESTLPRLEGEDYEALRKRLRDRKKALQSIPAFNLKSVGLDASLDFPPEIRKPLYVRDLQTLLLYSMLGHQAPVEPSR